MNTTIKLIIILLTISIDLTAQQKKETGKKILKFSAGIQYQMGFTNTDPYTYIYSAERNEKSQGKRISKAVINLSLSDYWVGNYRIKLYSNDSFFPKYTLSKEEFENQRNLSYVAFFVGKATGLIPTVGISKYKQSLDYVVVDKDVLIFNEENKELNIGDKFNLYADVVKYSLIWGEDARYDFTTEDFLLNFELSYYQTLSKGFLEHQDSYYITRKMDLLTEKFNAFGLTTTIGYITRPVNNLFHYRFGCLAELAYGDIMIIKVGYFSSLILGDENSHLKGILTLDGNLLESCRFGPEILEGKQYKSLDIHQFSYGLHVGLSYSF